MGCGGSKEAVAPPAKKETPAQEPSPVEAVKPAAPAPPAASKHTISSSTPPLESKRPDPLADDPDAGDPGPFMSQAANLGWLIQLAKHPEYGQLTPHELMTSVARPATTARKCRYLDTVGSDAASSGPLYWVWVEASWRRSLRELIGIVESHIKFMEPSVDPQQLGVWLDCICGHSSASPAGRQAALAAAREWLSASTARPTLMCMDKVTPPQHGSVPHGGELHGRQVHDNQPHAGEPHGTQAAASGDGVNNNTVLHEQPHVPAEGLAGKEVHGGGADRMNNHMGADMGPGSMLAGGTHDAMQAGSGRVEGSSHVPVMTLFRSSHGLHGFTKAQFNAMHVTHLD